MKPAIEYAHVCYKKHGAIAYITLNRPHVLNAMNLRMHEDLGSIWNDFEADDSIRVGVLSGASEKAFCVGQDLVELAQLNRTGLGVVSSFGSRREVSGLRLTERFDRVKPLVAKVHGYALGGGFELALACDIIVASEDAKFALPEAKLGLIPGAGGIFRLGRQMPERSALGYLMTGRTMTATRAWEFGLINEVVPAEKLDACVDGWVQDLLRSAPLSLRAIKEAISKSALLPMEQAFGIDYHWENIRKTSEDALEGPRAFMEKRLPNWQGR
jgi:dehydration protein DpgD